MRHGDSLPSDYMAGVGAMIIGGIAAIICGVNAQGKPLEDVARPLSVIGKPPEAILGNGADGRGLNPSGGG